MADDAAALGVEIETVLSDLGTLEGCAMLLTTATERFGRVDILIHTVAIRPHQPFETLDGDDWRAVRGVILDSAMELAMGVIPGMAERRYGRIVFFTGLGAHKGTPRRAHVSAAKMGIVGLTRGLAGEFADRNIRVNALSPGSIDTERANPEWYASAPITPDTIPMGRLGTTDEMAETVLFLASDTSGFMTGQTIHANGGEGVFG